jgi:hypothetical protein
MSNTIPKNIIYFTASMLLIAIAPMPYGYYSLLRIVIFGIFTWGAIISYGEKDLTTTFFFVIIAILFNPIIKIELNKGLWVFIDIAAGIFLLRSRNILSKSVNNH